MEKAKSGTSRNKWAPVVINRRGQQLQLHILWKKADGNVQLFSTTGSSARIKEPWGPVKSCEFGMKQEEEVFGFRNRSGKPAGFQDARCQPLLWNNNSFSAKWLEFRAKNQKVLLAKFINILLSSKEFTVNPKDEDYEEDGTSKASDKAGLDKDELEEMVHFIKAAKDCAVPVDAIGEILSQCSTKRTTEETSEQSKKHLKTEESVEAARQKEIDNKTGIELEFAKSIVGRMEVPLKKIFPSSVLDQESPLTQERVLHLAASMRQTLDLAQLCLTVCPRGAGPYDIRYCRLFLIF